MEGRLPHRDEMSERREEPLCQKPMHERQVDRSQTKNEKVCGCGILRAKGTHRGEDAGKSDPRGIDPRDGEVPRKKILGEKLVKVGEKRR